MAPPVLPPDVIRILSFHGPVEVWVGRSHTIASDHVPIVPFEDTSFLLVSDRSPLVRGLLRSCAVAVHARHPDGDYSLRLIGRAHAGLPLNRHPDRYALQPWLPDGARATHLLAVPFVAERIELSREEAGDRVRYFGPTPAGRRRAAQPWIWARAALGGVGAVLVLPAVLVPWVWLGVQGADYPLRPVALTLAIVAGLSQLAAARLLTLSVAFSRWREGRALERDAPVLSEGLLAPVQARLGGLLALGLGLVLPALLGSAWDPTIATLALVSSGGWLLGPALVLHLGSHRPQG